MEETLIKILRIISGSFFMLIGAIGVLVGIIAIIDPVGSKMADDSDPFGVPPTFAESFTLTIAFVLIFSLGILLVIGLKPLIKLFSQKLR